MKELSQIRMAVLDALRGAGIQAMEVFPGKQAMAYSGVVAAVGVGAASGKTAGFCHYLGEMKDPETQAVRERYGKELFGQITGNCGRIGRRTANAAAKRPPRCCWAGFRRESAPGNLPGRPFAGRRPRGCSCGGAFWNAGPCFWRRAPWSPENFWTSD